MAISADGDNVYVAAAGSSALDVFARDRSSGALTQATDGTGCIVQQRRSPAARPALQLGGANAVAVSPDDGDVYVTSLLQQQPDDVLARDGERPAHPGRRAPRRAWSTCWPSAARSAARSAAPEGLAVSPDGANVYATAFQSGAVDVLRSQRDVGRA